MTTPVPNELLIGHRMNADKVFASRVAESRFSRAEWDLIMSIVEFEIDDPSDPETAKLLPVTDDLDDALAATDEIPTVNASDPYSAGSPQSESFLDRLTNWIGRFSLDDERREKATVLVNEYAATLQGQLRQRDVWDELCEECQTRE